MNVFSPSEENETVSETTYRPGHESLVSLRVQIV